MGRMDFGQPTPPTDEELAECGWQEIERFGREMLPMFPVDALPPVLADWVAAESHATQTPADLAGLLSLATCSACIARHVWVEPKLGWVEPVNLFVAVLLEPGNRKSAVFTDATGPLRRYETELIDETRPRIAREQSERRQLENRLAAAEKASARNSAEAAALAEELAARPVPVDPRLIVEDVTGEKLGVMLGEQGGRLASMSPEGNVFDLMAGKYSKNSTAEFDVYLKGHSGDDLRIDRITREKVFVERPALTCAYTMQPEVIRGLADKEVFRGRGLLARFLYSAPESLIGHRKVATEPVPPEATARYEQLVKRLAQHPPTGAVDLQPTASGVFIRWQEEVEAMLGDGGQLELMRDWGGKLAGATLRLASVLHFVNFEVDATQRGIDADTIAAAVRIARYLIPHAESVLTMMHGRMVSTEDDAHYVLRWIERHGKRTFTKSEAHHHGKRRFPLVKDIDPALAELRRRNYIRERVQEIDGPGRPASPIYEVHPDAFAVARRQLHVPRNVQADTTLANSGNIGSAFPPRGTVAL